MKRILSLILAIVSLLSMTLLSSCALTDWIDKYLDESTEESVVESSKPEAEVPIPDYEGVQLYEPFMKVEKQFLNIVHADKNSSLDAHLNYYFSISSKKYYRFFNNGYKFQVLVGDLSSFEDIISIFKPVSRLTASKNSLQFFALLQAAVAT